MSGSGLEDTKNWFSEDPYSKAGVFEDVKVREWKKVFGPEKPLGSMVYAILCIDKEGVKDLRAETRPKHLEWWKESARNGFIGPFPAEDGSGPVRRNLGNSCRPLS